MDRLIKISVILTPHTNLYIHSNIGRHLRISLCLSHLTICHFWILPIWPPMAPISMASVQEVVRSGLFIEISACMSHQLPDMLYTIVAGSKFHENYIWQNFLFAILLKIYVVVSGWGLIPKSIISCRIH